MYIHSVRYKFINKDFVIFNALYVVAHHPYLLKITYLLFITTGLIHAVKMSFILVNYHSFAN